jgi:small subunit ribosomal protein S27Ae
MGKLKRKVKTKEKKQKPPRNTNKGPMWTMEGEKVSRTHRSCPKCGPAVFLAEHYDRLHCGHCGYTVFKRQEGQAQEQEDRAAARRRRER